jgi:hypothetical protein
MLRRRTRIVSALITAVALLASGGSSAWACGSSLIPGHGPTTSPCFGQHRMKCCTSACASAQASPAARTARDAVSSAPAIHRVWFVERERSFTGPRLRDPLPPAQRPPAIRFCVLRL